MEFPPGAYFEPLISYAERDHMARMTDFVGQICKRDMRDDSEASLKFAEMWMDMEKAKLKVLKMRNSLMCNLKVNKEEILEVKARRAGLRP